MDSGVVEPAGSLGLVSSERTARSASSNQEDTFVVVSEPWLPLWWACDTCQERNSRIRHICTRCGAWKKPTWEQNSGTGVQRRRCNMALCAVPEISQYLDTPSLARSMRCCRWLDLQSQRVMDRRRMARRQVGGRNFRFIFLMPTVTAYVLAKFLPSSSRVALYSLSRRFHDKRRYLILQSFLTQFSRGTATEVDIFDIAQQLPGIVNLEVLVEPWSNAPHFMQYVDHNFREYIPEWCRGDNLDRGMYMSGSSTSLCLEMSRAWMPCACAKNV